MTALLGVSTGALLDKRSIESLLAFEPDVVEFYNYPSSELDRIRRFCAANGIRPALHVPFPCDQKLRGFMPSGPDPLQAEEALALAMSSIRAGAELDALHVVVHYPSPTSEGIPDPSLGRRFVESIARAAQDLRVRVLVENLSANPDLYRPEDYLAILSEYPSLEVCLDVGHAHLLAPTCTIEDFIDVLGPRIRSAHVYDTSPVRYGRFGHEVLAPGRPLDEGWIDMGTVVEALRSRSQAEVLVFEPGPLSAGELIGATAGIAWLRSLLEGRPS